MQGRYHVYDRIRDWSMSAYSPPPQKKVSKVCTLSRGHADLASYETCEKIPHNKGIVTGPKTADGHDAIGDTVLRNPIKGYPTMGGLPTRRGYYVIA